MSDYALYEDPDTRHKQYMRFAPRSSGGMGDFPDFQNFQFDGPEASNNLKLAVSAELHNLTVEHNIFVTSIIKSRDCSGRWRFLQNRSRSCQF